MAEEEYKRSINSQHSEGHQSKTDSSFEVKYDEFKGSMCTQLQASLDKIQVDQKGAFIAFDRKDPIFSLSEPVENIKPSQDCSVCSRDVKKSAYKDKSYCRFCGCTTCKKCLKMFPLPKHPERLRAKICIHCFKKFLVREAEADKECYIRFAEATKDSIQKSLDQKIQRIKETQQRLDEINLEFARNSQEFESEMKMMNEKKRELKEELKRKEQREEELRENYDLLGKELNEKYQENKKVEQELDAVKIHYNKVQEQLVTKREQLEGIKAQLKSIRMQPHQGRPPKSPLNNTESINGSMGNESYDSKDQIHEPLLPKGAKSDHVPRPKKPQAEQAKSCCEKCTVF